MQIPRFKIDNTVTHLCFGCGKDNPIGFKLQFTNNDGVIKGEFIPGEFHQGWPGIIHGGVLFTLLDDALKQGNDFCNTIDINLGDVLVSGETFKNIELFKGFADRILEKDEWKKEFFVYENTVTSLYEACKPEILNDNSRPMVFVFQYHFFLR